MSDESEVSLKTVCCTCLNTDRKMQKLCRISEGVNLLYLLLSSDPDAYKVRKYIKEQYPVRR